MWLSSGVEAKWPQCVWAWPGAAPAAPGDALRLAGGEWAVGCAPLDECLVHLASVKVTLLDLAVASAPADPVAEWRGQAGVVVCRCHVACRCHKAPFFHDEVDVGRTPV